MKKRLILNFLIAVLLVTMLAPVAAALDTHIADGTCGDGISWSLDGYTLTITGSGEMADGAPWEEYKNHIEHVVLQGGITKVGAKAFYEYDRIETVDFGDALVTIGENAFNGCTDIDYVHLPDTFRMFSAGCFRGCTDLKYVYCDGPMPSFRDSCLWTGNYIAVFYPGNNPWPADSVNQLVHNFGGRLGIMMGSFDESAVAAALAEYESDGDEETETTETATEAPTEAPTEAATEPMIVLVTEPETVPTTVPETEPTTEATTIPETEEPTEAATETVVETTEWDLFAEETEPETVAEKVGGDGWIGVVLIAGVLTFLLIGALIFRSVSRKGGRYKG